MARRFGANVTLNTSDGDPVAEIKRLTDGRGVDVAIEALGRQETFENALRAIRPGGTLSSLGVYSGKLVAPYEAFYAGLGDQKIVTTLCPGGKERMRRLMAMIAHRRVDLTPLVTHRFALDDIQEAFDLFSHQRDGVLKVALRPGAAVAGDPDVVSQLSARCRPLRSPEAARHERTSCVLRHDRWTDATHCRGVCRARALSRRRQSRDRCHVGPGRGLLVVAGVAPSSSRLPSTSAGISPRPRPSSGATWSN